MKKAGGLFLMAFAVTFFIGMVLQVVIGEMDVLALWQALWERPWQIQLMVLVLGLVLLGAVLRLVWVALVKIKAGAKEAGSRWAWIGGILLGIVMIVVLSLMGSLK